MIASFALVDLSSHLPQQGFLVNKTPETLALGRARAAFFNAILKIGRRHENVDYAGYGSMLMVDHTTMLWPVGHADEVVFVNGREDHFLLTHWRARRSVPHRLFQIALVKGKRPFLYGGTMAKYLGGVKALVPKRYAKPLKGLLQVRQAYATYLGSAAEGIYYCGVVREDGSDWPSANVGLEFATKQEDSKVDVDGFAITEEEVRLWSPPKNG